MSEEPHAPSNSAVVVRAMAVSPNFFIIFSLVMSMAALSALQWHHIALAIATVCV